MISMPRIMMVCFSLMVGYAHEWQAFPDPEKARELFDRFKVEYGKSYEHQDEENKRFEIFRQNLENIRRIQAEELGTAVYGITEFTDMPDEEFTCLHKNNRGNLTVEIPNMKRITVPPYNRPSEVDWRKMGAVGRERDQGRCGACWAFSAVGNIASQWFLKKDNKTPVLELSVQQLIDCAELGAGCGSGEPAAGIIAAQEMGGLQLEADYPYMDRNGTCHADKSKFRVHVNGILGLDPDEEQMADWVAQNGTLTAAINPVLVSQHYRGGVIDGTDKNCNPYILEHAILIVGYGMKGNIPYWIIRNSQKPYNFLLRRGNGVCGIHLWPATAIIE